MATYTYEITGNLSTTSGSSGNLFFKDSAYAILASNYFGYKSNAVLMPYSQGGFAWKWDYITVLVSTSPGDNAANFTFTTKVTYPNGLTINGNTTNSEPDYKSLTKSTGGINTSFEVYSRATVKTDKWFKIYVDTNATKPFTITIDGNRIGPFNTATPTQTNITSAKSIVRYQGLTAIKLNDYVVTIDTFNQSTNFSYTSYSFNFNTTITQGTSNNVPLLENGSVKNYIYLLDSSNNSVFEPYGKQSVNTIQYPNSVNSGAITKYTTPASLQANKNYSLYIRTYYNNTDYIKSNTITFTTPNIGTSQVKVSTGYYYNSNKYFTISGLEPNQIITNSSGNIIKYSNNIIDLSDNNKRSITLNGSYFYYTGTNTYITSGWFTNVKPTDKPVEIGFYYKKSSIPLSALTLITNGTKISTDPFNTTSDINILSGAGDFRSSAFSTTISNLSTNTTYYFVSFLKKTDGIIVLGIAESFTTLPENLVAWKNPNLSAGQKWYQLYDNWKLVTSSVGFIGNSITPYYKLDDSLKNDTRNFPLFYYFDATFKKEKNYQFRTIVENFYDKMSVGQKFGSNKTNFNIKTPWGENHKFPVPYINGQLPFKTINLFLYSNINSIDIANKPINNITSKSGSNPKNPITYIANGYFNSATNMLSIPAQGLIYTNVNDTDWILQGYAFFNFFKPTKKNTNNPSFNLPDGSNVNNMVFDGNDEVIWTNTNDAIGGKGWHLIEKKNQLIWFDRYVPLSIDQYENTSNLPVGGNPDDYYSSKTSEDKWRKNNYVAKYIPYQSFNVSFSYSNNSNGILEMYLGSKLPKDENGNINYFDDYKKIAIFDKNSPTNCEFVGLEGNQYIYFVAKPIDYTSGLNSVTYSLIYLSDFKFAGSYNVGNNLQYDITINNNILETTYPIDNATYSIKLGNYNNVDTDDSKYAYPIVLNSNSGNGTFNSGIWENGVWNNGWRNDTTKKDFYNIEQYFSYEKDKKWRMKISGPEFSVSQFSVGDRVAISNIVAIDINDERKLLKNYYTIIEATYSTISGNYISAEFESDFPLRRIEIDSDEHRICITKNVWLSGVFLNGYFNGIWNNGLFSGYPLITKMDNSHWIDGIFNGGHFTARKYSFNFDNIGSALNSEDNTKRLGLTFSTSHMLNKDDLILLYDKDDNLVDSTIVLSIIDEFNLITGITWENITEKTIIFNNLNDYGGVVYSLISTGLAQNMEFYSNNVSSATSFQSLRSERVFSYNSWIDVNYSNQSAVNIGKPQSILEGDTKRSYSENNLYGYPTNDVLSSNSTFRDSFSTSLRKYKLGKKWKIFNDYVGDSSSFEEYFGSSDTTAGIEGFNAQGWDISVNSDQNTKLTTNLISYPIVKPESDFNNSTSSMTMSFYNDLTNILPTTVTIEGFINTKKIDFIIYSGYYSPSKPLESYTGYTSLVSSKYTSDATITNKTYDILTNKTSFLLETTLPVSEISDALYPEILLTYLDKVSNTSLNLTFTNGLTFSRTPEPLDSNSLTIGKELKVNTFNKGGYLNLIPSYDVLNRTNGSDTQTLEKSRYTMIEFDLVDYTSATNSYIEPSTGYNQPSIHFNNLNYITRNVINGSFTQSVTLPATYLPINKNINHLLTRGKKKQEFFINKRNLLMNFKGTGVAGNNESEYYLDNIKFYQVNMVPFFQYFNNSNINISVQIPSNGAAPEIEYADDNEDNIKSDTNPVVTYFGNSLIGSNIQVPEGINWVNDYGITFSTI